MKQGHQTETDGNSDMFVEPLDSDFINRPHSTIDSNDDNTTTLHTVRNSNSRTTSNPNVSDSNNGSKKTRKFACVECRQQKSKCDAHDRAPLPCTKCAKKKVPCVLKKDFRRTYKRAKNEAIEKRFKELANSLTNMSSEEILKRIEKEQMALLDNSNFTKEKVHHKKGKSGIPSTTTTSFRSQSPDTTGRLSNNGIHMSTTLSPLSNVSYSSSDNNNKFQSNNSNDLSNTKSGYISCKNFTKGMTIQQLQCTPKSLGDIYMSSEDISQLFQEFATKYHQFLPVVNLDKGPERIYSLSPCLFWVIILIGLRRKQYSNDLGKRLTVLVKATLAEITISPIIRYTPSETDEPILNVASVYSVQAFLLYTFWPPLTSSLSADTSWNTIGTALFQAIRVGLNTADFSKEFATENSELIQEQKRTWICCNIVSQFIASSFGFPAYVTFDHLVISSFKQNQYQNVNPTHLHNNSPPPTASAFDQSDELKQMTQIAYFEHQMVNTMNSNPSNKLGMVDNMEKLPLLNVLNQRLSELAINLEEKNYMDNVRKFLLLVTKVHLLTYHFIDSDSNVGSRSVSFETKCGLVKLYNAAINLLTHTHEMYESDPTLVKYFPGVFILNIWQSACIIGKLVNSSLSESIDIERGKVAYQNAIMLTYKASVLKHDMSYRSSGIMRSIWSLFSNMYQEWKNDQSESRPSEFNLDITVKSRMSVSVFFDCLYILKEKCGMAKLAREKNQLENEITEGNAESNGSAEDDEDEDAENGTENDGVKNIAHPERRARRIIETIPLDPNPINATTIKSNRDDLSSTATSPVLSAGQKSGHGIQSFLGRSSTPSLSGTPGRSLGDFSASNFINGSNVNLTPNVGVAGIPGSISTQRQQSTNEDRDNLDPTNILQNTLTDSNIKLSYGNNEDTSKNIVDTTVGINTGHATDTSSNSNKESPNSIMANWDNWQSDMVWKDVDILMNEFAFNPT
ncbi:similar to Saccharomyces cerevisiae YLR451W LEU3 Zinc-finger transcription factor that regulates genes involved in branched chain amino acid biosynthesis and ammonia assimilation [Maudiozyma saulgeensis]|uniref:Similar to Saccharomyces cerevisiae YLR451W LEU3 Zinc-finger transcription factor that regulates genes involved in branched chain amino acid biosynthesis and ammonia assimilation n=1 Tax=Maudiozyma saulgeensis TaxID=1789683 RepID=A0A1X7R5T7_9SACH|nr:similar to Saccharomyces cerevisiae YLR451W LEU3 Zinc-finger transcription factor that regulates genes involved in branched chain amino acid biosynthesis and ammonia assimilation [Kazachstania saulgeensis]